jgi:hypothetical protein
VSQLLSCSRCVFLTVTIHSRAPPSVLGVLPGQPVELRVERRLHEEYVPPPKAPVAAFSGAGNRLGSVVPAISGDRLPPMFSPESADAHAFGRCGLERPVDARRPSADIIERERKSAGSR